MTSDQAEPGDDALSEKLRYWREHPGSMAGRLRRSGDVEHRPVRNEITGGVAGFQSHHWDGRLDATVTPDPVTVRTVTSNRSDGEG